MFERDNGLCVRLRPKARLGQNILNSLDAEAQLLRVFRQTGCVLDNPLDRLPIKGQEFVLVNERRAKARLAGLSGLGSVKIVVEIHQNLKMARKFGIERIQKVVE